MVLKRRSLLPPPIPGWGWLQLDKIPLEYSQGGFSTKSSSFQYVLSEEVPFHSFLPIFFVFSFPIWIDIWWRDPVGELWVLMGCVINFDLIARVVIYSLVRNHWEFFFIFYLGVCVQEGVHFESMQIFGKDCIDQGRTSENQNCISEIEFDR